VTVRVEKKSVFCALEERWVKQKERLLREEVVEGLRQDSLFGFSDGQAMQ
jgi:maltooligosyltrehalose synthase